MTKLKSKLYRNCFDIDMVSVFYRHFLLKESFKETINYLSMIDNDKTKRKLYFNVYYNYSNFATTEDLDDDQNNQKKDNSVSKNILVTLSNKQKLILHKCLKKEEEYQEIISVCLVNWRYERLPSLDKSILLLATHYILNSLSNDIVIINVSLDLIKEFGDPNNYAYINAILDLIRQVKMEKYEKKI